MVKSECKKTKAKKQTYKNYIDEYYHKCVSGEIIACKKIIQTYEHLYKKTLSSEIDGFHFDNNKANRAIEFIEKFCYLSKGVKGGQPIKLELFQKAMISSIFGFVDDEGYRQYKRIFVCMARKNGKTQIMSALALYLLIADGENTPYIYSVATKKEIAKLAWDETVRTIKKSPLINKNCKCRVGDVYCYLNDGIYKPLASDSNSMDGLDGSFIIDEIHAIQDMNLYNVCADATAARRQPLLLMITTAGFVRNGIYDNLYKNAEDCIDGYNDWDSKDKYTDNTFLPIIYELDNRQEYKYKKNWIKANPGIGVIKDMKQLEDKVERAKAGNEDLNNLLTKDFDYPAAGARSFLMLDDIRNTEEFKLSDLLKEETYMIASFDLSKTTDLTSANALFKIASQPEKLYCLSMSWITQDALDKNKESKIPYNKWVERGFLRVCPGNMIDYRCVMEWFNELKEYGLYMYKCCYDPYSANQLVVEIEDEYGVNCCDKVIQGAKTLSVPLEYLKQQLEAKNIIYNNNPVLMWGLANLQVLTDSNGNYKPTKNRNLQDRNDPAMALLDGIVGYLRYTQDFIGLVGDKN